MRPRPQYRAFRFLYPGLDVPSAAAGLRFNARGSLDMVDGEASVRQAILLLLSTRPGERVMRPHYGCDLHRLLFQPNDETTAGLAVHYVRQALDRWEPRIDVLRLDAGPDPVAPQRLMIILEYRVRATQQSDQMTFAIDLMGDEA